MFTECGDGVATIKRCRRDLSSDGIRDPAMASLRGRLKEDLEASTWCFIYVVDFMILEDLGNIIDSSLSEVVLGKPFVQASKLTYNESLGVIRFAHRDDEVVFRMPQKTIELDLVSPLEKDKFEAFFVENLKVRKIGFKHVLEKRKGYYNSCMNLGQRGDGVTTIKRRRRDLSSNGIRDPATASGRNRLKEDLESSTWRRHMTTKFGKLDKFEGSDFRCWQKKMHFLLITLKVAYVLSTLWPEFVEEETLE
ncbi:hypothetical protein Tco_0619595 [Tanacetum coccineum]